MTAVAAFEGFTRRELATLSREYLLAGHLIDRAGMPQVVAEFGLDEMRDVAIEEWMGASPVYTRRTQRALGFSGDDVATIFKGMQLDIGAPPQFMDFRYSVHDERHGEFQLASCGALMDVEPMGDEFVVAMCHHIEDPTFDATACATNPRARVRPIHRPPRRPADRHPHCHWRVDIDAANDPLPEPEAAIRVAESLAAGVGVEVGEDADAVDPGGRADYAGAFQPEFRLVDLSRRALLVAAQEVCLQGHLLAHSFMLAIDRRHGPEAARRITGKQLVGVAGIVAQRLAAALDTLGNGLAGREGAGSEIAAVARVLDLHPAFHPRTYVDFRVEFESDLGDRLLVSLGECEALAERHGWSWPALLEADQPPVIDAIVRAVDPRARCRPVDPPPGRRVAWVVEHDPAAVPGPEPPEVTLTRFSTGAEYVFRD